MNTPELVDIFREYESRLREVENRDRANVEQLRTGWEETRREYELAEALHTALHELLQVWDGGDQHDNAVAALTKARAALDRYDSMRTPLRTPPRRL